MGIDNLTIGEARQLAAMFNGCAASKTHPAIGQKCIVRTYASGVFFGEVTAVENNDGRSRCTLKNARRLWFWKTKTGISLSHVALDGINAKESKICGVVPEHYIEDAIEFVPASSKAAKSIEDAETYNA